MIISKSTGMFGPIWVLDREKTRMLTIGGQCQGECYREPAGPEGITPGPVAASRYMTGWLLAGAMNPRGSGLMLGLGSGCGAVALLNSCPGVDLTVIEIDSAISTAAHHGFPLLDYYQDRGRLHIIMSDAAAFVQNARETRMGHWDFGLLDAYQGDNSAHCPEDLLYGMSEACTHLWLNCIDIQDGPKVQEVKHYLDLAGKPIVWEKPISGGTAQQNILLSTQALDPDTLASFSPYPDCDPTDDHVRAARLAFHHLAS